MTEQIKAENDKNTTLEELKTFSYKWGANFWKYPDMRIATLDEYSSFLEEKDILAKAQELKKKQNKRKRR